MPARRAKLYYLLEHERGSNMKFTPVINASALKTQEEKGQQQGGGEKKGKSKKGKKK